MVAKLSDVCVHVCMYVCLFVCMHTCTYKRVCESVCVPSASLSVFKYCPFLVHESVAKDLDSLISQWKTQKYSRPIRGVIILNQTLTKVGQLSIHYCISSS